MTQVFNQKTCTSQKKAVPLRQELQRVNKTKEDKTMCLYKLKII